MVRLDPAGRPYGLLAGAVLEAQHLRGPYGHRDGDQMLTAHGGAGRTPRDIRHLKDIDALAQPGGIAATVGWGVLAAGVTAAVGLTVGIRAMLRSAD